MRPIYHILATSLIIAGNAVTATAADDTDKLVVSANGGNSASVSLADISQITFVGDNMTITTLNGEDSVFKLADIESITFDLVTSSTDKITADLDNDLTIAVDGGIMSVTSTSDSPVNVAVYSINGTLVTLSNGHGNVSVDFNPMPAGIYIVKANNKTIKFIR